MDCCPSASVFLEGVLLSLEHMSCVELIRLSACSRSVKAGVAKSLSCGDRIFARSLLRSVLQEAGAARHDAQQQSHWQLCRAAAWLMITAKIPRATMKQENYLDIPGISVSLCQLLVQAGVRVTDRQLFSAARQRVQGIRNWVVACKALAMPIVLLPGQQAVVEYLFCRTGGDLLNSWHQLNQIYEEVVSLDAATAEDLLYVVLNSLPCDDGYALTGPLRNLAVNMFCTILQTGPARRLSTLSCTQLLRCFIGLEAERGELADPNLYDLMFDKLRHVHNMQQVTAVGTYDLLNQAVSCKSDYYLVAHLMDVMASGCKNLTTDHIISLATTTVQPTTDTDIWKQYACVRVVLGTLCKLPAASRITSSVCQKLAQELLQLLLRVQLVERHLTIASMLQALDCLVGLPVMQQLCARGVGGLMQIVLHDSSVEPSAEHLKAGMLRVISSLPAARSMDPHVLQELLLLAKGEVVKREVQLLLAAP